MTLNERILKGFFGEEYLSYPLTEKQKVEISSLYFYLHEVFHAIGNIFDGNIVLVDDGVYCPSFIDKLVNDKNFFLNQPWGETLTPDMNEIIRISHNAYNRIDTNLTFTQAIASAAALSYVDNVIHYYTSDDNQIKEYYSMRSPLCDYEVGKAQLYLSCVSTKDYITELNTTKEPTW